MKGELPACLPADRQRIVSLRYNALSPHAAHVDTMPLLRHIYAGRVLSFLLRPCCVTCSEARYTTLLRLATYKLLPNNPSPSGPCLDGIYIPIRHVDLETFSHTRSNLVFQKPEFGSECEEEDQPSPALCIPHYHPTAKYHSNITHNQAFFFEASSKLPSSAETRSYFHYDPDAKDTMPHFHMVNFASTMPPVPTPDFLQRHLTWRNNYWERRAEKKSERRKTPGGSGEWGTEESGDTGEEWRRVRRAVLQGWLGYRGGPGREGAEGWTAGGGRGCEDLIRLHPGEHHCGCLCEIFVFLLSIKGYTTCEHFFVYCRSTREMVFRRVSEERVAG